MMIRGPGLAASMSRYLIDRIEAAPNIQLWTHTELVGLRRPAAVGPEPREVAPGRPRRRRCTSASCATCSCSSAPIPETRWLEGCGVAVDKHGFVLTGADAVTGADGKVLPGRVPNPFETSVRGAFAVGDVRAGSVKRVGGAIGDGAAAVALIHQHLRRRWRTRDGGDAPDTESGPMRAPARPHVRAKRHGGLTILRAISCVAHLQRDADVSPHQDAPMTTPTKTFRIGGELEINRLGFGAMRITGKGIWGPPADREGALAHAAPPARAGRRLHRHRQLLRPRTSPRS